MTGPCGTQCFQSRGFSSALTPGVGYKFVFLMTAGLKCGVSRPVFDMKGPRMTRLQIPRAPDALTLYSEAPLTPTRVLTEVRAHRPPFHSRRTCYLVPVMEHNSSFGVLSAMRGQQEVII
jgi:hypothetical protein